MEKISTSSAGQSPSAATQSPRDATYEDLPRVLEMAKAFYAASPYKNAGMDEHETTEVLRACIDFGCLYMTDSGFIAGLPVPLFVNSKVNIATEIAWWAPEGGGKALLDAFESWAETSDCLIKKMTNLMSPHTDKVHGILTGRGYIPIELAYVGEI